MSSPPAAAKTVGRDTAAGSLTGAMDDAKVIIGVPPGEVTGAEVAGDSDWDGAEAVGAEQPATSSATAATAYAELGSGETWYERGVLRSIGATLTSTSPRPMGPSLVLAMAIPTQPMPRRRPSRPIRTPAWLAGSQEWLWSRTADDSGEDPDADPAEVPQMVNGDGPAAPPRDVFWSR